MYLINKPPVQANHRHSARSLLLSAILCCMTSVHAAEESPGLSSIGIDSVAVCYNFACNARSHVSLSQQEWAEVAGWFNPVARNGADEREQIRHAVGWMEELVGRYTPTHRDVAGNLPENAQMPGQLDCIDESRNTTTYMKLLQTNNLLRFHRVVERAYRRALFDQHWSGQIEEIASKERYVVDSWFQDNGMLPYVQTAKSWKQISILRADRDNSAATSDEHNLAISTAVEKTDNQSDRCKPNHGQCAAQISLDTAFRE